MSQDPVTSAVCTPAIYSGAEIEDWLAMEVEEQKGCRLAAVQWCETNARPILSVALIGISSVVLAALVFG